MRVRGLSQALARRGHPTHVLFVGDPTRRAVATSPGRRLTLYRWCQWISAYHPGGVYEGEEAKLRDFNESAPPFVVESLARPVIESGHRVVIMGEEWHTAEAMCRISDLLHASGLRSGALLLWNANNTMGFDRINWGRLGYVTTITTVSRYMKHLMWPLGVNPLVIPNGIARRWLRPVDPQEVARLRRSLRGDVVLSKVGRWDPAKRWLMAVETAAALKRGGADAVLVAVGGVEPHRGEVMHRAQMLGLMTREVVVREASASGLAEAVQQAGPADLLSIRSFLPPALLQVLYAASDAVLANSGREPFGLVGLEAMAAGGVVLSGGTGEDYAVHLHNGIVLETADAEEAAWYVRLLRTHPTVAARLTRGARRTARRFVWDRVIENLLDKVAFLAESHGARQDPEGPPGAGTGSVRPASPSMRQKAMFLTT